MNEILFIGYDAKHTKDFAFDFPENKDFYLLLLITSPAEVFLDGQWQYVCANSVILFPPEQEIHYRACGEVYSNDWIRFVSDETYVTSFPLQGIPFPVSDPEYCHHLIKLLTWEAAFTSRNSEWLISDLMHALFLKLNENTTDILPSSHSSTILNLRKQIYNQPQRDWTVPLMAEYLHISTGYLQSLYKSSFGISCMDDVIEGRIRLAKDQLMYTDKTIAEIAEFCGYCNVEHFCRQFKQNMSVTPKQYRFMQTQKNGCTAPNHANMNGKLIR